MTHRRHHPLIWFALAAMLAVALLPTVSHALAHARAGVPSGAEVCTPRGLQRVAAGAAAAGQAGVPLQAAGHLEHCPLCTLAHDHPGVPPARLHAGVPLCGGTEVRPAAQSTPRMAPAWRSALPRGPPAGA